MNMNKTGLIIQREYLTRVKKKSFLLTTIIVPLIIIGFYAAIIAISVSNSSEKVKVAVMDRDSLFNGKIPADADSNITYTFVGDQPEKVYTALYKQQGYNYFLYIPGLDIHRKDSMGIVLHSESAVSLGTKSKIENVVNRAIEAKRLQAADIPPDQYKNIHSDIAIKNELGSGQESMAGVAYGVSFACGFLIYIILMIYGTMVMRGVMEEKMNRIAEVVVSSVKPFQLMLGKIIGIGAVGITQFAIWFVLLFLLQFILPVLMPGLSHQIANQASNASGHGGSMAMFMTVSKGLQSLPVAKIAFSFLFYFLGGYLLYASLFAAVGSVISEDQQEAQQLVFPVMMPIIFAFVLMIKAISQPDSGMAIFGSLFPLTSPIVMMGRITYHVPAWQLISSMVLLVLGFLFFTWLTAKIYRTGILLYGKKVTWKEMIKWALRRG